MPVPPAFDLQGLLAEDQWIRRLARKLAGDAHTAEDLVQETWVAALAVPTEAPRPRALRPWLRGILRNLWRDGRRSGAARAARERIVARAEALEPAGELVAELELRRCVAEALLALEEPYRSALYLRFFRDQSLAAIAKHQRIAPSSAHERIQQGLARLRTRLDREHGGRRGAWALGLLSLARPAGVHVQAAEAIAMAGGLKVAASVLVLGSGAAWYWLASERGAVPSAPAVAEARADAVGEQGALAAGPAEAPMTPARAALAAEPRSTPAVPPPEPAAAATLFRGELVDPEGAPLGGMLVGWKGGAAAGPEIRSAVDGSFVLELASGGTVQCLEPGFVTLVPGERAASFRTESTRVVAAPRASFGGVVLDPAGAPVAGAKLRFALREALFRGLGLVQSTLARPEWDTTSDAQGLFRLADVAGGPRVLLQVEALGFWVANVDLPEISAQDLVVRLEPSDHQRRIHGLVLDPSGAGAAGALVSAGDAIVACDAEGRFELVLGGTHGTFGPLSGDGPPPQAGPLHLVALQPGFLPAREPLAGLDLAAPVVLQLGPRPAAITGTVRESDGRASAGIVVWPRDSTPFGREVHSGGEGMTFALSKTVEDELAGGYGRRGGVSDAAGAFEVPGLLARSYELMAYDPERAELFGPWTVAAGAEGVELVLVRSARRARVAGRVVSAGGTPLAGVEISPQRQVPGRDAQADAHGQVPFLRPYSVTTDAHGRFEFPALVAEGTSLQLEHSGFGVRWEELAPHADLEHLELVLPLLCDLQVDLAGNAALADAFSVLDAEQRVLELQEVYSGGWAFSREIGFLEGLSPVVRAPETGVTLVLSSAGVEVLRQPLVLAPGELTLVRP